MVMVASPCHAYELIKIDEAWSDVLHCVICGASFRL
jgi:hypothetical protein